MSINTNAVQHATPSKTDTTVLQQVAGLAFGVIILLGVGFLPMAEVHNAAHDTRHSLAFPCH